MSSRSDQTTPPVAFQPIFEKLFWGQLWALTWANMRARYRKTVAGFIWVVLSPVIMFAVQAAVFQRVLKIDMQHYELFLVAGLLPWIFLSQSLQMSVTCFVTHGRLLKSYQVSPLVYLGAMILDNLINFVAAFFVVLLPVVLFRVSMVSSAQAVLPPVWGLALIPIAMVPLFVGTSAVCLLAATVHVFFRDTAFVLNFFLGIAFFLTPIFYPIDALDGWAKVLVQANVFYYWIEPFRTAVYDFSVDRLLTSLLRAFVSSGCALALALTVWRAKRNALYFNI